MADANVVILKAVFKNFRSAIMVLESPTWKFSMGNLAAVRMFEATDEVHFLSCLLWNEFSPKYQLDGNLSKDKTKEMIAIAMDKGSHNFKWTYKRLNGEVFPATVDLTRIELQKKYIVRRL